MAALERVMLRVFRSVLRLWQGRSANVATLAALSFPLFLSVAVFAVDEASLYLERRALQAAVDLAAMAAVDDPANARAIAFGVLQQAGVIAQGVTLDSPEMVEDGRLRVETGSYAANPALSVETRFSPGADPADAVRVRYAHAGRLMFSAMFMPRPTLSATGTAHAGAAAGFSLGSRVASLDGGLANAVLRGALGTTLSLNALDHRALASLDVDMLQTLDALATRLNLTAGTYNDILLTDVTLPQLAAGLAAAGLGDPGATVMAALAPTLEDGFSVQLGDIVDLGALATRPLGAGGNARLDVSALQLLSTAALLAEGGRPISINLGATVPGLTAMTIDLAVGEPMASTGHLAVGPDAATLQTAQLRLDITLGLRVATGTTLGILDVRLPLSMQLAPSQASLTGMRCPPNGSADLLVSPGLLALAIGRPATGGANLVDGPAAIVNVLNLVRVTAFARANAQQSPSVRMPFSAADIANGTVKTAATVTPLRTLLTSLLSSVTLDIEVAGLPLLRPVLALGVDTALRAALIGLAPTLDTTLVGALATLGIAIGEADVRVNGVSCTGSVLVG